MGKELAIVGGSPMVTLNGLQFMRSRSERAKSRIERTLVPSFLMFAAILFTIIIADSLLNRGTIGLRFVLGVATILVVLALALVISITARLERPISIREGIISLEFPIRRMNGPRSRQIPITDIADVEPSVSGDGANGVRIRLIDGTSFFLAQSSFGDRGLEIMEALSAAFGRAYQSEIRNILLTGRNRFGFPVIKPVRISNTHLVLSQRIRRSSGKETREVALEDVKSLDRVSTPYAGSAYLISLADGTYFLIREPDAEAVGLPRASGWSDMIRTN